MSARILIVEDNQTNLDLMLYLLRAFGHDAEGITDSLAGIERALTGDFELVISDILMPGIDGVEFARRFRASERANSSKLIAVTALAMVGDRERLLAMGFDGYISKPIEPELFVGQVELYLNAAGSGNKPTVSATTQDLEERNDDGPLILAVDDVRANLEVLRAALQPSGYRFMQAQSVKEARESLALREPSLVLCDIHMPDGNGLELLESMKADARLRHIPFLVISATAWQTADRMRAMQLGARSFLLRPVDPQRLLDEVRSALGGEHGEGPRR